ncbi:hypothetical protein M406DRAFT_75228 [Cryphonectria parasitica EP155]|uniref:Uncharacterized protein n=1 Tax=Cryphonectria parasitica (strain ATCC 38755 / EP155) TaxID=660469 RepID=A0A9P4XZZ6_CRYP1|nr:uncharacterized protein M406DRAFT_75228 [Cryphonectria parasitica EP155]KAF3764003.1 hypothetical protein M406DRAFT_75228 [Cryphonectria parasitica EP155]
MQQHIRAWLQRIAKKPASHEVVQPQEHQTHSASISNTVQKDLNDPPPLYDNPNARPITCREPRLVLPHYYFKALRYVGAIACKGTAKFIEKNPRATDLETEAWVKNVVDIAVAQGISILLEWIECEEEVLREEEVLEPGRRKDDEEEEEEKEEEEDDDDDDGDGDDDDGGGSRPANDPEAGRPLEDRPRRPSPSLSRPAQGIPSSRPQGPSSSGPATGTQASPAASSPAAASAASSPAGAGSGPAAATIISSSSSSSSRYYTPPSEAVPPSESRHGAGRQLDAPVPRRRVVSKEERGGEDAWRSPDIFESLLVLVLCDISLICPQPCTTNILSALANCSLPAGLVKLVFMTKKANEKVIQKFKQGLYATQTLLAADASGVASKAHSTAATSSPFREGTRLMADGQILISRHRSSATPPVAAPLVSHHSSSATHSFSLNPRSSPPAYLCPLGRTGPSTAIGLVVV